MRHLNDPARLPADLALDSSDIGRIDHGDGAPTRSA